MDSILGLLMLIFIFLIGIFFLIVPFLLIKYVLKRKFNWWTIILCLIASYIIFQIEVWVWWKFWEYIFIKLGEAI